MDLSEEQRLYAMSMPPLWTLLPYLPVFEAVFTRTTEEYDLQKIDRMILMRPDKIGTV